MDKKKKRIWLEMLYYEIIKTNIKTKHFYRTYYFMTMGI